MNAAATTVHLQAILESHRDVPILLLWDRALWHRGPAIRSFVEAKPRLSLLELPTAAQEHVWRATRRSVSHNHTQRRLPELAERFEQHLTGATFPSSFLERYGWYLVCPGFT